MAILDLVQYIDTHVCQYFRFIVYYKCINGQNSATPVPDMEKVQRNDPLEERANLPAPQGAGTDGTWRMPDLLSCTK